MVDRIQTDIVHLACVDVDSLWESAGSEYVASLLGREELERAQSFRSPVLQARFMAGRFFLKQFLAAMLGWEADQISFELSANGKPFLSQSLYGNQHTVEPHFNFSRSQQYAVCGISACRRLGVDVEFLQPMYDMDKVATVIFSDRQLVEWRSFSAKERQHAFYRAWTRKEASVKLVGRGISQGVKDVITPMNSLGANRVSRVKFSGNEAGPGGDLTTAIISEWKPVSEVLVNVALELEDDGQVDQNRIAYDDVEQSAVDFGLDWPDSTKITRRVFELDVESK